MRSHTDCHARHAFERDHDGERRRNGGWGAGLLYDRFGDYLPAFSTGMAFNLVNLAVLLFLISRPHTRLMRQPQTST
jgi:hypothetical protein